MPDASLCFPRSFQRGERPWPLSIRISTKRCSRCWSKPARVRGSQAELGERFGLTEQFIISYEEGSRLLDPAEYLAICRAIGVDPYVLLQHAEKSADG